MPNKSQTALKSSIAKTRPVNSMKKFSLTLLFLTVFGCNQKEGNFTLANTEIKTEPAVESEIIIWIDTISNNKFLKIYSKPENDWKNLTAEFGNENNKHTIDLNTDEYQMLGIPFTNQIKWITEKSFALVNGCGTACKYVLIFNIDQKKPIIHPVEFYPEIEYADFKTDNPNLYIAVNENYDDIPSFVIVDTDSQRKDTINLPNDWVHGVGNILSVVDEVKIENSKIEITQNQEDGKRKILNKILTLK